MCLVGIVDSGYLRFTQPVSRSGTGEDRTKASIVAQVVPPEPRWSSSQTISSTSTTFLAASKVLHFPPNQIRAINVFTIIDYEFICILNRNMRFYFSQCIAVEGSRIGVRILSVLRLSPTYVGEIKCVTTHIVEFWFGRLRKTC